MVEADKQLQRARTMGPSLRIDRVEISTDIDDPDYKSLGLTFSFSQSLTFSIFVRHGSLCF